MWTYPTFCQDHPTRISELLRISVNRRRLVFQGKIGTCMRRFLFAISSLLQEYKTHCQSSYFKSKPIESKSHHSCIQTCIRFVWFALENLVTYFNCFSCLLWFVNWVMPTHRNEIAVGRTEFLFLSRFILPQSVLLLYQNHLTVW